MLPITLFYFFDLKNEINMYEIIGIKITRAILNACNESSIGQHSTEVGGLQTVSHIGSIILSLVMYNVKIRIRIVKLTFNNVGLNCFKDIIN